MGTSPHYDIIKELRHNGLYPFLGPDHPYAPVCNVLDLCPVACDCLRTLVSPFPEDSVPDYPHRQPLPDSDSASAKAPDVIRQTTKG